MPEVHRSKDVKKIEKDEYLSKQLRDTMSKIYKGEISGKKFTVTSEDGKTKYKFREITK